MKIDLYKLKYRWYARARYYRAHTFLPNFLKQLKNQFGIDPRLFRRIWDLGTRVFDKANPNLPGIFLFERYLESYFEKIGQKWITQNIPGRSEFCSLRAFRIWSWICHSPFGSLANWFCVCLYWGSDSDVATQLHIRCGASPPEMLGILPGNWPQLRDPEALVFQKPWFLPMLRFFMIQGWF